MNSGCKQRQNNRDKRIETKGDRRKEIKETGRDNGQTKGDRKGQGLNTNKKGLKETLSLHEYMPIEGIDVYYYVYLLL